MGMDTPARGKRARPRQRGGVDQAAYEKVVLGLGGKLCPRANAPVRPLGQAPLDHKRHGNAPKRLAYIFALLG
jgi:hypothetical protein